MKNLTKEMQKAITPSIPLELLKGGSKRFVHNLKANGNLLHQANETSGGQHLFAVVLRLIDNRNLIKMMCSY